jgi:heme exporter protein C
VKDKEHILGLLGLGLLIFGCSRGLLYTPPETHMQDVQRIFFIHVPTAWNTMLIPTAAFFMAIGALLTGGRKWDAAVESACEVTVLFTCMTLVQGMIWGRPTWGVYWDWDPRLTTTAIMAVLFAGVLSVRSFASSPDQRRTWTAVATIIAYVDVPIVYKSVEWWDSLHQKHSAPATVSVDYHLPLRVNAFAILFLWIWLVIRRARLGLLRDAASAEAAPPPADSGLIAGDA